MSSLSEQPVVIIPAYNESGVILRLLESLHEGYAAGKYNVVVACNGCSDNTVEIVENHFPDYQCLDIELGSKINAINEAEALGLGYPRVYVDADVVISTQSVLKIIEELEKEKEPLLLAPRAIINCSNSDAFVRLFYSAWKKTTFFIDEGYGSGVYALNQSARQLFDTFPNVTSDDGFVRHISSALKVGVCEDANSAVEAPRSISDLVKIKVRIKAGKSELTNTANSSNDLGSKRRFVLRPTVTEFIFYVFINLYIGLKVKLELRKGGDLIWHRDESTR